MARKQKSDATKTVSAGRMHIISTANEEKEWNKLVTSENNMFDTLLKKYSKKSSTKNQKAKSHQEENNKGVNNGY